MGEADSVSTSRARALWTYAAWLQDKARLDPGDGTWRRRADLVLPLVKGYSSEKAYELLSLSLQVLGGSGYTQDHPIEQYLRDAKIDTVYEGTTGIQALDLFFREVARDQGVAFRALAADIADTVKDTRGCGGRPPQVRAGTDPLEAERGMVGELLVDTEAHLAAMVEELLASRAGEARRAYRVGLHANGLLESMAETTIGWLLLRQAELAVPRAEDSPFHRGKVASARFFLRHVAPQVAARRRAAQEEDGSLMDLPVESF